MNSEFDTREEPKDRTRWIWLGVVAALGIMVFALWAVSRNKSDVTRVRARHILIKFDKTDPADRARALELITDLRKRIEKGESFSRIAKEYSADESSAARGGDLGYYPRNVLDPEIEKFVWNAPIGQLSDVLQSAFGFHLAIVLDRQISAADRYEMDLEKKAIDSQKTSQPAADSATPQGS